jgi:phosphopantetheine--protein transferase-like protein
LPYVGNDVVDLKEPANAGKSRDSRFLKKILTDAEIKFVGNAENREAALWSLWACKEAACKVIKKSSPDTAFIPRRWQTVIENTQSEYSDGEVIIPEKGKVFTRLFVNSEYVHCIGADTLPVLDKLIWNVESLPEEEGINPSLFLRHCLGHNLAQYFSLNFHQIKIIRKREKGELQPPRVYVDGRKTEIDVSLSHDGRFVAYAYHL